MEVVIYYMLNGLTIDIFNEAGDSKIVLAKNRLGVDWKIDENIALLVTAT